MSKEEITSLKEEFLKEIRNLEKRLNLQLTLNLKELTEKNDKFIQEFNQISKNNKSLTDLISSKNIETHKINELEIFKKKTETMVLSHDIKLNTAMKDLNDIKYTVAKEVSENLTVPGFVGPSCKYKSIGNFIAVNINDTEKLKNESESNKKENRELKRKMDDMIKTILNLVDKSNEKSIEYVNNKMKHSEEIINNKFVEINDKIFNFRTVLLTQDKIEDFRKKIFDEINNNNYNKEEIDGMVNNILKNIEKNIDNIKSEFNYEINKSVKSKMEKYDNEIKELNKSLREMNIKLMKSKQFQSKLFKELIVLKNNMNKNSNNKNEEGNNILDFNFGVSKNLFEPMRVLNRAKTILNKKHKNEEEKAGKNKIIQSFEKNKTTDSVGLYKYKSSKKIYVKDLKRSINDKEKRKNNDNNIGIENNKNDEKNKENINNNNIITKNDINEDSIYEELNNNSSIIEKEKNQYLNNEDYKLNISMDNKNNISYNTFNYINDENIDIIENLKENKNFLVSPDKKVKFRMDSITESNEVPFNSDIITNKKEKSKEKVKTEANMPLKKLNSLLKKDSQKSIDKKQNQKVDFSNLISYGVNSSNKVTITPIEQNIKKEETNSILHIFQEKNSSIKSSINNTNTLNKTLKKPEGGYSLHKLASIGVEEKIFDTFPSLHNTGKISDKTENLVKPFGSRNNPLYQSYDSKLDKYRSNKNNLNNKKITSAFGRTSYSVYNKKEEGIQNLINNRINSNYNKRYKNNNGDFNFELSPVAKIKIYDK